MKVIVNKVDELGRVVIPIELSKVLDIKRTDRKLNYTPMKIFTERKNIILRKYEPGCYICGKSGNLTRVLDMDLCITHLIQFKGVIKIFDRKDVLKQ